MLRPSHISWWDYFANISSTLEMAKLLVMRGIVFRALGVTVSDLGMKTGASVVFLSASRQIP
jgi:hypothetical protein